MAISWSKYAYVSCPTSARLPAIVVTLLSFLFCADCVFHSVKERSEIPEGWTPVRHAPLRCRIELHIGLKQGQVDIVEQHLGEGETADYLHTLSNAARFLANVKTAL